MKPRNEKGDSEGGAFSQKKNKGKEEKGKGLGSGGVVFLLIVFAVAVKFFQ